MFDASIVPLKALFGTFILLAVFVVLFIVLLGTFELQEPKFFLVPVLSSVAIALLRSIKIINAIIKDKEDDLNEKNMEVFLNTCPEYWVKDTVNLVNSDTNDFTRINICKNYSTDQNGKIQFVGGSGEKFAHNFKGADQGDFITTTAKDKLGETLTNLNDKFVPKETEGFQQPDYLHTSNDLRITQGNPDNIEDDRLVTYLNTAHNTDNLGKTDNLNTLPGEHIHYKGNAILHSNDSSDDHEGVTGYGFHIHEGHRLTGDNFRNDPSYTAHNWINHAPESTGSHGVELNLDRLNEAKNICELSKDFLWTEARNKCNTKVNP